MWKVQQSEDGCFVAWPGVANRDQVEEACPRLMGGGHIPKPERVEQLVSIAQAGTGANSTLHSTLYHCMIVCIT